MFGAMAKFGRGLARTKLPTRAPFPTHRPTSTGTAIRPGHSISTTTGPGTVERPKFSSGRQTGPELWEDASPEQIAHADGIAKRIGLPEYKHKESRENALPDTEDHSFLPKGSLVHAWHSPGSFEVDPKTGEKKWKKGAPGKFSSDGSIAKEDVRQKLAVAWPQSQADTTKTQHSIGKQWLSIYDQETKTSLASPQLSTFNPETGTQLDEEGERIKEPMPGAEFLEGGGFQREHPDFITNTSIDEDFTSSPHDYINEEDETKRYKEGKPSKRQQVAADVQAEMENHFSYGTSGNPFNHNV